MDGWSGTNELVAYTEYRLHRPSRPRNSHRRIVAEEAQSKLPTGSEVRLFVPSLCLSGIIDRIQHSRNGYILTEYKTGKVVDKDGSPLQRHIEQLRLYALMVEELSPNVEVELRLVGETDFDIVWGENERRNTRKLLEDTIAGLSLDTVRSAQELSNPGKWWHKLSYTSPL